MSKYLKQELVKGGKVTRDLRTGRFTEVSTEQGVNKPSVITEKVVKGASSKRKEAMKRLVNR